MCTVSIVPANNHLIFTFNRDEKPERNTEVFLESITTNTKQIYFAKDIKAGGTWFAADDQGNVAMLFNGGFAAHIKAPHHITSRGKILLQIISSTNLLNTFQQADLTQVEPFSLILYHQKNLYRATWDGETKHLTNLAIHQAHIFSSATLYTNQTMLARQNWLTNYLKTTAQITADTILHFHQHQHAEDHTNGLVIDRPFGCKTLSISQAVVHQHKIELRHVDLLRHIQHQQTVSLVNPTP
jgi:uncharacterized protein with NRDE domain